MKIEDNIKVWLPGESPWAVVLARLSDSKVIAQLNNDLVNSSHHGYQYGDVAVFEIDETAEYKVWSLAENQIKIGPTSLPPVPPIDRNEEAMQALINACKNVPFLATCIHGTLLRAGLKIEFAAGDATKVPVDGADAEADSVTT
jgi:hypothetical protein